MQAETDSLLSHCKAQVSKAKQNKMHQKKRVEEMKGGERPKGIGKEHKK